MPRKHSGEGRSGKPGFLATMAGIHKYSKRLADGTKRWYYKISREKGAPVFWQRDGQPEPEPFGEPFQHAYRKAHAIWIAERHGKPVEGTVAALAPRWIQSLRIKGRDQTTISAYEASLKAVNAEFGPDPLIMFTTPETRKEVKTWHHCFATNPRTADYHLGTLVALLNFAIDEGEIAGHVVGGIDRLHEADRSDIIIEPNELEAALPRIATPHGQLGIRFAAHSGFRLSDCVSVPITARKGNEIIWSTKKSRGVQDYCLPITDELAVVLDELQAHRAKLDAPPMTILFSSRGRPWTPRGLSRTLRNALVQSGVSGKSFHDLRGTAATNYKLAGFSDEEIAEFLGWKVDEVKHIIKRYVGREALVQSRIIRLKANRK